MLWPGSDVVNEPPETLIDDSVARFSPLEVRYRLNVAGAAPPVTLKVWFIELALLLTAMMTTLAPEL